MFNRHIRAALKRRKRQDRDNFIQAYRVGAFIGLSKLPPLDQMLERIDRAERPVMAPDDIRNTMGLWVARSQGIEARKRPDRRV